VWNSDLNPPRWSTERGLQEYGVLEDFNNWFVADHLRRYLEEAGAVVHTVRDFGIHKDEIYTGRGPNPQVVTENAHFPWWQMSARYYFYEDLYSEHVSSRVYDTPYVSSEGNKSLRSRPYYANWLWKEYSKCDLYISVHSNAFGDASKRGTVVLHDNDNDPYDAKDYDGGDFSEHTKNIQTSYDLAVKLGRKIVETVRKYYDPTWQYGFGSADGPGVWSATYKWFEVRGPQKPNALIEYGYHTNSEDSKALLDDRFRMIATQATYKAICDWWGVPYDLPSRVTDLRAELSRTADGIGVKLTWTAPGEDGTYGNVKSYILKYSTYPISTEKDFDSAVLYQPSLSWVPKPRYSREEKIITEPALSFGVTYYFALRAINITDDISRVSNYASVYYDRPTVIVESLKITDLRATPYTAELGAVMLTWTVPPEDPAHGNVKSYILKYSTAEISSLQDFEEATLYTSSLSWIPRQPLSEEERIITGLIPGITYYFSIQTISQDNNFSPISNCAFTYAYTKTGGPFCVIYGVVKDKILKIPIENVKVSIYGTNVSTRTDSSGRYTLILFSSGVFTIELSKENYATMQSQQIVSVIGEKLQDRDFELEPSGATLYGWIKDANGTAISNVACQIVELNLTTMSDQNGYYRFYNIQPGNYTVVFKKEGKEISRFKVSLTQKQWLRKDYEEQRYSKFGFGEEPTLTIVEQNKKLYVPSSDAKGSFSVEFNLSKDSSRNPVAKIYDIRGRLVREISLEKGGEIELSQYSAKVLWDGKDNYNNNVPPGIYFFKVECDDKVYVRKIVVAR
jgi:N-acetylmuramoyl-L-alanine amidase